MKKIEITPKELALFKEMREAQKKYFRTRSTTDLSEAKALEKEVDKLLDDLQNKTQQQLLF